MNQRERSRTVNRLLMAAWGNHLDKAFEIGYLSRVGS